MVDDPLFEAFKRMRGQWPTRGWSWDARLTCVTSSFSTEFQQQARAAVAEALTLEWTPATLGKAPQGLRDLVERSGGFDYSPEGLPRRVDLRKEIVGDRPGREP